jgi:crotonobetainyl-CoA:carnitine CoA-transferase CaiB-like acyl-CoA transferase
MTAAALSDLRILDLFNHVAGAFCTNLFADFGADVIKVEASGEGETARHIGPFPTGTFDLEMSCLFLYLNTNKRSITLDIASAQSLCLL